MKSERDANSDVYHRISWESDLAPQVDREDAQVYTIRTVTCVLDPVAPFRLDLTAWALRRRPDNAIDRWDGQTYRRALALAPTPVEVAVTQVGPPDQPELHVTATGPRLGADTETAVGATLHRLLGLRTDLTAFYRCAAPDATLGPLAQRFCGLKPPRFPTLFEAIVNGIACQEITLTQGIRLLNRLAEAYGATVDGRQAHALAFPRPVDLATPEVEALNALGFSRQKVQALVELAGALAEGRLDLETLDGLDDGAALTRLRQLRGVGRWTAEYVLLRGLGRIHVFHGDDVGARNNLRRWLNLPEPLDYAGVAQALAGWRDFGGLIYFHLLLDRLAEAGYLEA